MMHGTTNVKFIDIVYLQVSFIGSITLPHFLEILPCFFFDIHGRQFSCTLSNFVAPKVSFSFYFISPSFDLLVFVRPSIGRCLHEQQHVHPFVFSLLLVTFVTS